MAYTPNPHPLFTFHTQSNVCIDVTLLPIALSLADPVDTCM